jgi:hypothetical protein
VYPAVVDLTIEHLRNTGDLAEDEQVRVALVRADNIVNLSETATAVTALIEFNGESANDNAPEHFRSFSIASPVLGGPESDYGLRREFQVECAIDWGRVSLVHRLTAERGRADQEQTGDSFHHWNVANCAGARSRDVRDSGARAAAERAAFSPTTAPSSAHSSGWCMVFAR